ncbi:MAG TPA: SelB C-terminal domain-containing protein, partial [Gemmatales bacterium]|nr:SelB C-terminal domain-containing protein [Gemmatales bacterium]
RTSAITGEGISTIREQLENTAKQVQVKKSESWFRLAIDRAFSVQGYGTVVTGTVISGSCRTGEELAWLPSGEMIRVRHLQRHEQPVNEIHSGMRAAMNLAGVKLEEVARGQELATPGYLIPSKVLTVHLHNLPHAKRTLKHRTSIRLHLGTDELIGKVSLLDCDQLEPGSWALSQLFLEKPALATFGQSFIIRDPSATITFGGGRILQPAPDKIRRRHISYLERIEKLLDDADPQKHAMEVAWFCGNKGVSVADLVRGSTLTPAEAESTIKQGLEDGKLFNLQIHETKSYIIHHETLNETQSKVKEVLQELHVKHPLMATHDRCLVGLRLSYLADDDFIQAIIDNMLKNNLLEGNKKRIALVGHVPKMSINQRKLKEKILHKFYDMKYQPPDISNFVAQAGGNVNSLKDILQVCVAEGELVQIAEDVYLHTEHERNLYKFLKEAFKTGTGLTVATIRDILGTTRKYAVPLCEYLDRLGITRREGDLRYLIDNKP